MPINRQICSLIKIAPSGTVSTLHTFPKSATLLGLTNDANGNFYSTLENGGAGQNPAFTIYKTTPTGQTMVLQTFVDLHNVDVSQFPNGRCKRHSLRDDGSGGPTHNGTIFKLTPRASSRLCSTSTGPTDPLASTTPTALRNFSRGLCWIQPVNLYGATPSGGSHAWERCSSYRPPVCLPPYILWRVRRRRLYSKRSHAGQFRQSLWDDLFGGWI